MWNRGASTKAFLKSSDLPGRPSGIGLLQICTCHVIGLPTFPAMPFFPKLCQSQDVPLPVYPNSSPCRGTELQRLGCDPQTVLPTMGAGRSDGLSPDADPPGTDRADAAYRPGFCSRWKRRSARSSVPVRRPLIAATRSCINHRAGAAATSCTRRAAIGQHEMSPGANTTVPLAVPSLGKVWTWPPHHHRSGPRSWRKSERHFRLELVGS
jgi:hypothetical protein